MDNDALHRGTAEFSVDLHPAYSNKAKEGVHLQLQSRLMRWDNDLGGLLLAYSNLQKLPAQAEIRPYFPYLQLKVKVDVLLFKPKVGQILCGQVNKMGADYIGLNLFGAVNGAVGRQNIRKSLQFDHQSGNWKPLNAADGEITEKSDILFTVDKLRIEPNGMIAVMGSMKEPWCGLARLAAIKTPSAFPDAAKWQQARQFQSNPFTGEPQLGSSQPEEPETPTKMAAGILEPLVSKEKSKKRKRLAEEGAATTSPESVNTPDKPLTGKLIPGGADLEPPQDKPAVHNTAVLPEQEERPLKKKKRKSKGLQVESSGHKAEEDAQGPTNEIEALAEKTTQMKKKKTKQKEAGSEQNTNLPNGSALVPQPVPLPAKPKKIKVKAKS